jgi:hypothetical protein
VRFSVHIFLNYSIYGHLNPIFITIFRLQESFSFLTRTLTFVNLQISPGPTYADLQLRIQLPPPNSQLSTLRSGW